MRRSKVSRSAIDPLQAIWSTLERTWYPRCSEFERTLSVTSICTVEVRLARIPVLRRECVLSPVHVETEEMCKKDPRMTTIERRKRVASVAGRYCEWVSRVIGKARGRAKKEREKKRNRFARQWRIHVAWILCGLRTASSSLDLTQVPIFNNDYLPMTLRKFHRGRKNIRD